MSANIPTIKITQFGGSDNRNDAYEVGLAILSAVNVDFSRAGKPRRRAGYRQVYAGAVDAAWGDSRDFIFQAGENLLSLAADYRVETLRGGLSPTVRGGLTACRVLDRLYWSNGVETGCIQAGQNRSWGLAPPASAPLLSVSGGMLIPGRYQCACTFIRADGQESAAGPVSTLDLAGTGLALNGIPQSADPTVDTVAVYLRAPDGEQLYLAGYVPHGMTAWAFPGGPNEQPLQTQFKMPAPAGAHIAFYRGAVYVAAGEYLYASEPFNYELFDARKYIGFSSRINVLGAVADGLYVGTETDLFFLSGAGLDDFTLNPIASYGAVSGTAATVPASMFQDGGMGTALAFVSQRGICAGFAGGNFRNLTEKNFHPDQSVQGAALWREANGQSHFLAAYVPQYGLPESLPILFGKSQAATMDAALLPSLTELYKATRYGEYPYAVSSQPAYLWLCWPMWYGWQDVQSGFLLNESGTPVPMIESVVGDYYCYRSVFPTGGALVLEVTE